MQPTFKTLSENAYADHLTSIGLYYDYERQWGSRKPEFTIYSDATNNSITSIAEVKEFHHTKAQEAILAARKTLSVKRDPHPRIRERIREASQQFKGVPDYPCILILGSGGDSLPLPLFVMAAMLGDHMLAITTSSIDTKMELNQLFGRGGKMVAPTGKSQNTRISAIGLLSAIRPGERTSGHNAAVKVLGEHYLASGTSRENLRKYSQACTELRQQLTQAGNDLETSALQVDYILNPLTARPFPRHYHQQGYTTVTEYDITSGELKKTYDWFAD